MNTTEKGNAFEEKVFKVFSRRLNQNLLLFNPEHSKIYQKKGYFSRDRGKNIIVDISIESFIPGHTQYSILTVIECKDYSGAVPVNDIEEFHHKLQQIGGANIKGIVVASSHFDESAFNVAKANGIALVRMSPSNRLKWDLSRAIAGYITRGKQQEIDSIIHKGLTTDSFTHDYINFFSFFNGQMAHAPNLLFNNIFRWPSITLAAECPIFLPPNQGSTHVEFVPERDIEDRCNNILKDTSKSEWETPIHDIIANLERSGELRVEYRDTLGADASGNTTLGKISFNPTVILISKQSNENHHREKFTLAHELGHHRLNHSRYMSRECYSANDLEHVGVDLVCLEDIRRMEWQANCFASNLLLPKDRLLDELTRILHRLDIREKGHGVLFIDNQPCNRAQFVKVTDWLIFKFKVSRQVIEIALKRLGLINDKRTAPTSMRSAMYDFKTRFL